MIRRSAGLHTSHEEVPTLLQGDVHRFYLMLRAKWPNPPTGRVPELDHVRAIAEYYARLDPDERQLLLAWARKEQSGIGVIPTALSGVPMVGLLFVPLIQQAIRDLSHWVWLSIWAAGVALFVTGIYVHQRQHAYTALHITLLERLCKGEHDPPKR